MRIKNLIQVEHLNRCSTVWRVGRAHCARMGANLWDYLRLTKAAAKMKLKPIPPGFPPDCQRISSAHRLSLECQQRGACSTVAFFSLKRSWKFFRFLSLSWTSKERTQVFEKKKRLQKPIYLFDTECVLWIFPGSTKTFRPDHPNQWRILSLDFKF